MTGAIVFAKAVEEDLEVGTGTVVVPNPGGGDITGTRINLASLAYGTYVNDWTPGTIAAAVGSFVSVDISIPGVMMRDFVLVTLPGVQTTGVVLRGWASAADTVTVSLTNNSGIAVNPGTAKLRILVFKTNL